MRDEMIDVGELSLRVRISGNGPPMLFTSTGWGPSVDLYLHGLRRLEERFTVACGGPPADRAGAGGQMTTATTPLDAVVDDFDGVRRAFGWEAMWMAGHSMGGHIALRYLASHPDTCAGVLGFCTYGHMDDQYRSPVAATSRTGTPRPSRRSSTAMFEFRPRSGNASTDHVTSGHFPGLEQPEQFWTAVDSWLDARAPLARPGSPAAPA